MARIHDESTRYVLSDQAIIALACKNPTTAEEVHHSIAQADLATESSPSLSLSNQSPSSVVCSHLDDIYQMTQDKLAKLDALLPLVLEKCLGTDGTCPVSVFNYSLLINFKTKIGVHSAPKQNGHRKNLKQFTRKSSRDLFVKKFSCKAPVYHNCRIYANDGRLLCYCDRKKLEWYMNRGLAKLVEEEPPAIMLLFEPKGRPEDEGNDFYIQTKKNICVGCGEGNHYLRYRIIPSCYRVHFPEHLKSHRSHDIVLLCVDCHEVAHAAAERYKKQVASEFGIPLFVRRVVDSKEAASSVECDESRGDVKDVGVSPLHLRTAAMALLRHGNRMPSSRREELLQTVKMYYGGRDISEEDLERALLIGLSPHERRKLERKKGVPLKYSAEVAHMNKQENSSNDTDANSFVSSSVGEHGEEATGNSEKDMNEESRIVVADDSGGDGVIRAACARVTGAVITGKSRDNLIAKLPLTLVSLENKVNAGR
ncbi:protein RRP6-like 3 isoform X1 [Brassica rapa]|nr:protein RRP6-like 3 isoform X1 [Brassica rapa]